MIDPSCFMFWYTSHFVFAEENDSAYITVVGFKSCWDAEWPRSLIFWFSLEHLTFLNLSDHWVMRSRNYKIYYLVSVKIIIMTLQWNVRLNEHACCFLHCCRQRWSWILNAYCMESKWTWLAHTSKMQIILSIMNDEFLSILLFGIQEK